MSLARFLFGVVALTVGALTPVHSQAQDADSSGMFIHLPLDGDYRETARGILHAQAHGDNLGYTPGVRRQALVLGAQRSWIDLASDSPILGDQGVTLELWAHGRENIPQYAQMNIAGLGPLQIYAQSEALGRYSARISMVTTQGYIRIPGSAPFSALRWTHLALVYDAQARTASLYVNGALAGHADNVIPSPINHRDTLTLGSPDATSGLEGAIDDVRVYNYARSAAAIARDAERASRLPDAAAARGPVPQPVLDSRRTNQASDTMTYYAVFNVLDADPPRDPVRTFVIMAIVLVALLLVHVTGLIRMRPPIPLILTTTLLVVLFIYLPSHFYAKEVEDIRDAMRTGRFTIVEGRVEEFQPPQRHPRRGNTRESFKVVSHERTYRYSYLEGDKGAGFHVPSDRGGPIRQMLRVRIADVDGQIARLEIAPEPGIGPEGFLGSARKP